MFTIDGTTISMVRGDTLLLDIEVETVVDDNYIPAEGDVFVFAAKKNVGDYKPVIFKTIPTDTLKLRLDPADTNKLPFGDYIYDIQARLASGYVDTIISRGTLKILQEVCT